MTYKNSSKPKLTISFLTKLNLLKGIFARRKIKLFYCKPCPITTGDREMLKMQRRFFFIIHWSVKKNLNM